MHKCIATIDNNRANPLTSGDIFHCEHYGRLDARVSDGVHGKRGVRFDVPASRDTIEAARCQLSSIARPTDVGDGARMTEQCDDCVSATATRVPELDGLVERAARNVSAAVRECAHVDGAGVTLQEFNDFVI